MCVMQNPKNVQVKEELTRLRRRLKAAERELQEKRTQSEQRADKIKKLKDDLEQITAGVIPLLEFGIWVVMSPGAACIEHLTHAVDGFPAICRRQEDVYLLLARHLCACPVASCAQRPG
jgi:hypothetical protein